MKIALALILALGGGTLFAQPYYTAYQMREAADQRDHARLSGFINFPAVRESLKKQGGALAQRRIEQEVGSGPLADLGGALGGLFGDQVVEAAITPEMLASLMQAESSKRPVSREGDTPPRAGTGDEVTVALGYASWDRFVVDLHDGAQTTRMVLGRQGLAWKLVAVELE